MQILRTDAERLRPRTGNESARHCRPPHSDNGASASGIWCSCPGPREVHGEHVHPMRTKLTIAVVVSRMPRQNSVTRPLPSHVPLLGHSKPTQVICQLQPSGLLISWPTLFLTLIPPDQCITKFEAVTTTTYKTVPGTVTTYHITSIATKAIPSTDQIKPISPAQGMILMTRMTPTKRRLGVGVA